ncbi:hypothetical protein CTEN210_09144 [Chaetoceros tenuissimus]|uniref:Ankyrin repeat-containing domain n=1 Tax=Chaetoceros tenuissimus TaxID=426638 RepID=A0AAD3H7B5_9STRA|nr:hypothetical protein CTEN210_09144 [Chaetoceros tenuissimus]
MSSVKRIKVAHKSSDDMSSPSSNVRSDDTSTSDICKHIQDLPSDVFRHCLEFVGKGSFAFVAPVSKHFYWNYINLGVEMKNNVIDVDVILQQGKNKKTTAKDVAAASGITLVTECFLEAPKKFKEKFVVKQFAVENKNEEAALTALKWLREHNIPWNEQVCDYAAMYGNLKALRWARENGCPWNNSRETYNVAAKYGTLEILDYCFENNCPVDSNIIYQMPFDDDIFNPIESELQDRSLKVYKWLHQHSVPWNEVASLVAAQKGHLETLKWAIENVCPYSLENIIEAATTRSNLAMLKYCLQYLAPTDVDIYVFALNKMCRRWWSSAIIEVIQMFRNNGIPWNRDIIPCAERLRESNVADWLRCVGCPE